MGWGLSPFIRINHLCSDPGEAHHCAQQVAGTNGVESGEAES